MVDEEPFAGFEWDAGNREKCRKHGLTIEEIESVFDGEPSVGPDLVHSVAERRFRAVGRGESGRYVFVVFTIRSRDGERLIRPVSARYMHAKEVQAYEQG